MNALAVQLNSSAPADSARVALEWVYAKEAAGVVTSRAALVLLVQTIVGFAQVVPSVIGSISVFVVDLVFRPLAGHPKPCQAVGLVLLAIDANNPIASDGKITGNRADSRPAAANEASEAAGFRVVLNKLAQTLRGKIAMSHEALLLLIGQKPVRVEGAARVSLF